MRQDAKLLNDHLNRERRAELNKKLGIEDEKPKTLPQLLRWWETKSEHWQILKPRTRGNYQRKFKYLVVWAETLGNPDLTQYTTAIIRKFINSGVLKPALMTSTISALSAALSHAVEMGIISRNPCKDLSTFKKPHHATKQLIRLWTKKDVETYVNAALEFNWLGGAILIQGLYDCTCRITDGCKWTKNDLKGNVLTYRTNKSDGQAIAIAIMSQRFVDLAKMAKGIYLVTKPHHKRGKLIESKPDPLLPFIEDVDDNQLKTVFRSVQRRAVKMGAPHLALKHLRHTGITEADNNDIKHDDLKAVTTHTSESMAKERYSRENIEKARNVAKKRGIID